MFAYRYSLRVPVERGFDLFVDVVAHSLEPWLFETPLRPIACTSSPTRRVET